MISRFLAEVKPVHALDYSTYDASCGTINASATANVDVGRIIDRLGLGESYTSAMPVITGDADIGTSTAQSDFAGIEAFLLHSSTTCADDFSEFSSANRAARARLFIVSNTTSSLASGYMTTSTASHTTFGIVSATSTGSATGQSVGAPYDITAAGRYLRLAQQAEIHGSSSGGVVLRTSGAILFGQGDEAPPGTTSTGVVHKTS